jgi:hypothetical protein
LEIFRLKEFRPINNKIRLVIKGKRFQIPGKYELFTINGRLKDMIKDRKLFIKFARKNRKLKKQINRPVIVEKIGKPVRGSIFSKRKNSDSREKCAAIGLTKGVLFKGFTVGSE